MPDVKIRDVTLRDGMQIVNRQAVIPLDVRLELLDALFAARLPYIEVGSFVSPRRVASMSDTPDLLRSMQHPGESIEIAALVPNLLYYQELTEVPNVDTVALFVSASEEYSQTNTRMSKEQAFGYAREVAEAARADGRRVRGYLSCAFLDLGDGSRKMDPASIERDCRELFEMECETVALSDTSGRATPDDLRRVLRHLEETTGLDGVGVHLHDRYGQGILNSVVAYEAGVRVFDSSIGGVGGNPAVANSVGNIATEELVYLFHQMGVDTGVETEALLQAGELVAQMTEFVGDPFPASKVLTHQLWQRRRSSIAAATKPPAVVGAPVEVEKDPRPGFLVLTTRTRIGLAAVASVVTMAVFPIGGLAVARLLAFLSLGDSRYSEFLMLSSGMMAFVAVVAAAMLVARLTQPRPMEFLLSAYEYGLVETVVKQLTRVTAAARKYAGHFEV